ncbi:MAG: glutamate--tRNA ligase [Firmicutes bacterium]|nr:glutamate--tRNA ligase [Bacillota bacterium]
MEEKVRTRFAPSPTGYMHIGNLRTALYAWLFARARGGEFILRIEDTDQNRKTEGAEELIYKTLAEVGLTHDEGPDVGGPCGPYIQSERREIYLKYARELVERGGAYYCFCTKERLEALHAGGAVKYDKHCLSIPLAEAVKRAEAGEPYVIRQNIPTEGATTYSDLIFGDITIDNKELEDNVLIKSDGLPTYNFANVIDDRLMGINYVIRGIEYLSSTPKYNHLYRSFGWELPSYIHLQPIMKDAVNKLSKRNGDASFADLMAAGYLKEAVVNYIALLGWNPKSNQEKMTMDEMLTLFDLKGISKSASIYDPAKARWLNAQYVKELSPERFLELAAPYFDQSAAAGKYDYKLLAKMLQSRVEIFSDLIGAVEFLERFEDYDPALYENAKNKTDAAFALPWLKKIRALLAGTDAFDNASVYGAVSALVAAETVKPAAVFWVMRIAVTGAAVTPGGATEMAELLGKERTLARLDYSIDRLQMANDR